MQHDIPASDFDGRLRATRPTCTSAHGGGVSMHILRVFGRPALAHLMGGGLLAKRGGLVAKGGGMDMRQQAGGGYLQDARSFGWVLWKGSSASSEALRPGVDTVVIAPTYSRRRCICVEAAARFHRELTPAVET